MLCSFFVVCSISRTCLVSVLCLTAVGTVWFAAYYLGETTTGYLFSLIVPEYGDVVVREEGIKELAPETRDRIKLLKKRILDLNGEIDTLYEELANPLTE